MCGVSVLLTRVWRRKLGSWGLVGTDRITLTLPWITVLVKQAPEAISLGQVSGKHLLNE
jgi:hypothetical protein